MELVSMCFIPELDKEWQEWQDRICIFSGVLRELSGPGFLEAIAPQWLTKKM
jgi:hypothetical protein